jgi:ATP-dependent RNA helicase DDX47/RRP3
MSDTEQEPQKNWADFGIKQEIVDALESAGFKHPTNVQNHSLKHIKYFADLIISARTGEGKTLCFLLPILNNLFEKYHKA